MFKILVRITLVLFSVIATYYFFYWLPLGLLQEILPSIPWLRTILSLCIALLTGWFIWKKTANRAMGFAKITSVSAITVGSIGFILGFFGPIIFVPESNLGPLLGLFITGPLGVVLGAIIGLIYWGIRRETTEV